MIERRRPVIIGPAATLTAEDCRQRSEARGLAMLAMVTCATLAIGVGLLAFRDKPVPLVLGVALLVVLPLLWRYPRLALYLLVASAALFETFSLNFPDSLTDRIPFFKSISSQGVAAPVPLTPAELLMMLTLGILIAQRVAARQRPLEAGPLFGATAMYAALVGFGIAHGLAANGNLTIALWEARAPIYFFLMYLVAFNLAQTPGHLRQVMWVFLIAVAAKGILGTARYVITLGMNLDRIGDYTGYNSLLAHEESFFFALFVALLFALFLFRAERRLLRYGLLLAPPVLLAFLANERRAGMLVLLISLVMISAVGYALVRSRRKLLMSGLLLAVIALPLLVLAIKPGPGLLALPSRTFASVVNPSGRDLSSDAYRVAEAQNVKFNISRSPLIGQGYGKEMELPFPIPDLSKQFIYWDVIPHNTLLWVWMRLGLIGFIAFWFLVGRIVVQGLLAARAGSGSPFAQAFAAFSVAAVAALVAQGMVDMGLADWRIAMVVGALAGGLARLSTLQRRGAASTREPP